MARGGREAERRGYSQIRAEGIPRRRERVGGNSGVLLCLEAKQMRTQKQLWGLEMRKPFTPLVKTVSGGQPGDVLKVGSWEVRCSGKNMRACADELMNAS